MTVSRKPHPLFLLLAITLVALIGNQHVDNNMNAANNEPSNPSALVSKTSAELACSHCGTIVDIYRNALGSEKPGYGNSDSIATEPTYTIIVRMQNNSLRRVTLYSQPEQNIGQHVKLQNGNLTEA